MKRVTTMHRKLTLVLLGLLILNLGGIATFLGLPSVHAAPTLLTRKWTGYVAGGGESLLIADIRDSPGEEIIHVGGGVQPMSGPGRVSILRASDGVRIDTVTFEGIGDTAQAQMADVDNDGLLEIIVPLQHPAGLYILNAEDLSVLWHAPGSYSGALGYFTNPTGGRVDSSPVIGDIDNDGYADIFVGIMAFATTPENGAIRHLEYDPNYSDSFPGEGGIVQRNLRVVWHPCAGGMSLGDTDNDGTYELYMADRSLGGFRDGSWGRGLRSFWAENLSSRWDVYDNMMSSNIPMLVDVNGDGIRDVVATDLSRAVLVLNSSNGHPLVNDEGTVLRASIPERRNHYQSSVYDIDGDGNLEIISADGWEASYDYVTVWDLWDWTLDAMIDTTAVGDVPTRSWKGPTVGNVYGDANMEIIVTTFDAESPYQSYGMVQVYDHNFELVLYTANDLVHRAIESVVQDIDGDGFNELLVLSQGGQVYCYDTAGLSEVSLGRARARSEVQFYSESRLGASVYVPYEPPHTTASYPSTPSLPNDPPAHAIPNLIGSTTLDDLVAMNQSTTDPDGDAVTNIYSWIRDGTSIANLILPFDTRTDPALEYSGFAYTRDYSDSGNDGIVFGASWTPEGIVGGAYSFDGSNDFIQIEEQGSSLGGTGAWDAITIEFWVKATDATSTRARTLIQKMGRPYSSSDAPNIIYQYTAYRVDFARSGTTNQIAWSVYTENPSDPEAPNSYQVTADIADAAMAWHHVVCTYTSGVGMRIYVDGAETSFLPGVSGNILETNASPRSRDMGEYLGDWGYNFLNGMMDVNKGPLMIGQRVGGMLDELRIYPTEISPFLVNQRYLDTKDGSSSSSTLPAVQTQVGDDWRCDVTPNDGKTDGITRSTGTRTIGFEANTAPVASDPVVVPASPVTGDDLVASYGYFDADGHPEYNSIIQWYKNSVATATGPILLSSYTAKGESWYFTVTPFDGFTYGDPVTSDPVVIENTPPAFTSVTITPDPAFDDDTLTATPLGGADADGDAMTYAYQWQKNVSGTWLDISGATASTLTSVNFVRGDDVKVLVTIHDADDPGNTLEAVKWIVDSDPPTTGTPILSSASGDNRDDDELTTTPTNTQDPDGDDTTNIFNWLRGGVSYTNALLPFDTASATTATDYSGYDNHGLVYGATPTTGLLGGAYSFDGNDYIAVTEQSNSLGSDGTWTAISVEFWILATSTSTETVISLHDVDYSTGGWQGDPYGIGYSADVRAYGNQDRFYWTVYSGTTSASIDFTDDETYGVWRHVVCTYEDGVGLILYVDGVARATTAFTGPIAGTVDGLLYIGGTGSGGEFSGLLDEVKIYPTALSAAQVFQNYIDQHDGLSDHVTIVPQETTSGQTWRCQVTPNDGWQDGTTMLSNQLTITSPNTKPHIDWYAPADSSLEIDLGESITFEHVSSDPNDSPLSYSWLLDEVEVATTQNWSYTPTSASVHNVTLEVSDGSLTDVQGWTVNVAERAYLVVRGSDDSIYYRTYDTAYDSWADWKVLPSGSTTESPAAASASGKLFIVVCGTDGNSLWFSSLELSDDSFSGWTPIEGVCQSSPSLTSNGTHLFLAVRGIDNGIYIRIYDIAAETWAAWISVGGATSDTIGVAVLDNELHVVVRSWDDDTLWHNIMSLEDNSFSGWTNIPGTTNAAPTLAVSSSLGTLELAVKGISGDIYLNEWNGASWQGWNTLSTGSTIDSPAITVLDEMLHIVVRSSDGLSLWHCTVDLNTDDQSVWLPVLGSTPSTPILTS